MVFTFEIEPDMGKDDFKENISVMDVIYVVAGIVIYIVHEISDNIKLIYHIV